uniref:Uncharacterized protein n=1 Tax=Arundo donax TaxID=35708 RepID=A0A0A8YM78_ARUDO
MLILRALYNISYMAIILKELIYTKEYKLETYLHWNEHTSQQQTFYTNIILTKTTSVYEDRIQN